MLDNNAQRIRRKDKGKYHVIILANQNAVVFSAASTWRPITHLLRVPYMDMIKIQNINHA